MRLVRPEDQFLYAELVNARGLGKGFASLKLLEPEALSSAMEECLKSTSIQSTAREVGEATGDGGNGRREVLKR